MRKWRIGDLHKHDKTYASDLSSSSSPNLHNSSIPTFECPDFSLAVFDFVNASYGAAEGWDVSATHPQQRSEREFGFPWHAIKSARVSERGARQRSIRKARERLEESVFENGRAADMFWDGYVLAACGE